MNEEKNGYYEEQSQTIGKKEKTGVRECMEQRRRMGFVNRYDTWPSYNYRYKDETDTILSRLSRMARIRAGA